MPKVIQNFLPKSSPSSMPSAHSYTVMNSTKATQNEDDDDICPVCESECTCRNNATVIPTRMSLASTATPVLAPLKIKLPPRALFQKSTTAHPKSQAPKHGRTKLPKQEQTTVDSATVDGTIATTSQNYVLVHHRSSSTSTIRDSAGVQLASTSHNVLRDPSPLTPESELETASHLKQRKDSKRPKRKPAASVTKLPTRRQSATKKILSYTPRSKKNKDATWLSPTSRRKGKRPVSEDSDGRYSDDEMYVSSMVVDSDGGQSTQLPNFVATNTSDNDDDDITTSIADSFDSDSFTRADEEELVLSEKQRTKVRYELLKNEESWHMDKRKWDHLRNSNNWEIRPRKRSVGPDDSGTDSTTESESEMEIDEEEEEEDEGDEEDDPDIDYGRGLVTGWRLSDDEDFDAKLFFATLTDSSGPGSDADIEDVEDSGDETDNSDLSAISIREAVAAGLLHSPSYGASSLVVTEDWDGRLVFTNDLKDGQGVLDVHFEVSAAQRQRNILEAMEVDTTSSLLGAENNKEGDSDEEDLATDDGETTDDILDQETPHVVPLPIRFPTPPVASIDPLSTLSPIVQSKRSRFPVPVNSPKPADILAGACKMFPELSFRSQRSRSASVDAQSVPGTSASSQQNRQPRMGNFVAVSRDPQRTVIIDGTVRSPLSPFPRTRRVGRGREWKRIMVGNDTPHPLKRTRQASLPSDSRTSTAAETDDPVVQSSPELPLPTSIGLDDVLDASFLDSDDSVFIPATTLDNHLRNLARWDRVPVSTFRRSRTADVSMLTMNAPPSDGVSYGSTGGRLYTKSPGSVPLWLRDKPQETQTPGSVAVSPVIFPVRAGEKLAVFMGEFQDTSVVNRTRTISIGGVKSHKQKRKEKKKRVQLAKVKAQAEAVATFSASVTFSEFSSLPAIVPPLSL